jgi:hypothetical protein
MLLHPKCDRCGASMWLTSIEPDEPDHDKRVFECPECRNTTTQVVRYRALSFLDIAEHESPSAASHFLATCRRCGSEAQLVRAEKFPEFKGEVRIYACGKCGHKNEAVVRD